MAQQEREDEYEWHLIYSEDGCSKGPYCRVDTYSKTIILCGLSLDDRGSTTERNLLERVIRGLDENEQAFAKRLLVR